MKRRVKGCGKDPRNEVGEEGPGLGLKGCQEMTTSLQFPWHVETVQNE